MVRPTVISIFCGTGGSSLGYKWAGYKELLAVDFESHAVECFKLNFPKVPCWQKSVTDITGQEILDFCKIKKGELDVLDGSPPCQGFSIAGKRKVNDSRNDLFKHYVRLINDIQPKVFVMENVSGMAKGKMKGKFIEIMKTLKALNYQVKCKKMNAMYYGVPQSRERLIFIGVRKDLKLNPSYPNPNKKVITVRDVDQHDYMSAKYHPKRYGDVILKKNKPCQTIVKQSVYFVDKRLKYGIQSLKAFCGFPLDWILPGTFGQKQDRLGNAVMPKFMQAIAETIKKEMLS